MKKFFLLSAIVCSVGLFSSVKAVEDVISVCGSGSNGSRNWGRCYNGVCKSSINPIKTCSGTTEVGVPTPAPIDPENPK